MEVLGDIGQHYNHERVLREGILPLVEPWSRCRETIEAKLVEHQGQLRQEFRQKIQRALEAYEREFLSVTNTQFAAGGIVRVTHVVTNGAVLEQYVKASRWRFSVAAAVGDWFEQALAQNLAGPGGSQELSLPRLREIKVTATGFEDSCILDLRAGRVVVSPIPKGERDSAKIAAYEGGLKRLLIERGIPAAAFLRHSAAESVGEGEFFHPCQFIPTEVTTRDLVVQLHEVIISDEVYDLARDFPQFGFLNENSCKDTLFSKLPGSHELRSNYSKNDLRLFREVIIEAMSEWKANDLPSLGIVSALKSEWLDGSVNGATVHVNKASHFFAARLDGWFHKNSPNSDTSTLSCRYQGGELSVICSSDTDASDGTRNGLVMRNLLELASPEEIVLAKMRGDSLCKQGYWEDAVGRTVLEIIKFGMRRNGERGEACYG